MAHGWDSPITSDLIVAKTISFDMIGIDREGGATEVEAAIYYIEVRPQEEGRHVLVRHGADNQLQDVISREYSARTRVHEYGGGAFCVSQATAYFSNYSDQRLYVVRPGVHPGGLSEVQPGDLQLQPQAITVEPSVPSGLRYADMLVDPIRHCLYCVCEEHNDNGQEPQNYLARISLPPAASPVLQPAAVQPAAAAPAPVVPAKPVPVACGNSFYSSPVLSPDLRQLAFLCWDHPNMPWDATTLMVADISQDGSLSEPKPITSGVNESVFQPLWGPDGFLYYVCDRSGWWNLYRYDGVKHEPLCPLKAEFGQAQWVFGLSTYGFHGQDEIICAVNHNAVWKLHRLNLKNKQLSEIPTRYTNIQWLKVVGNSAIFRGASAVQPQEIVRLNLLDNQTTVLKTSVDEKLLADITAQDIISSPVTIEFPTTCNRTAHAFYYAPKNQAVTPVFGVAARAVPGETSPAPASAPGAQPPPPLIIKCHGGPHSSASSMFNLEIQYWTSRGFAVADVNYGGSTGYGREYRQRLNGQWGVVDVDDAANCALYLVSQGLADKKKLLITGRSAGGYTVLCALTFKDVFAGGASYYGISDIETLIKDTHKFESHYDATLIGPYPEKQQLYKERSAIYHTDKLNTPIVFFQGSEDKVVLPNQTMKMLEALKNKGVPCALIMFEGERHGFSNADTVKKCLEGELYFYLRILGLPVPADLLSPLTIYNEQKWDRR